MNTIRFVGQLLPKVSVALLMLVASSTLKATPLSPNDPSISGGLQAWYSAGTGVTTQDNSGTGGSATAVNAWADQSGLGNNALQATAAKMPTLVSNWLNGQPGIQFQRTSITVGEALNTVFGTTFNFNSGTVFLVGSFDAVDQNTAIGMASVAPYANSNNYRLGRVAAGGTTILSTSVQQGNGTTGGANTLSTNSITVDTTAHIFATAHQKQNPGQQLKLYVDGVDQNATLATTGTSLANNIGWLSLGERQATGAPASVMSGFIGEVIVYNTLLTPTQISGVNEYLNDKYFVAVPEPNSFALALFGGMATLGIAIHRSRRFVTA